MKLFFTLSNIELQDNGYDIAIGDKFYNEFNISIINHLEINSNKINTQLQHIKDNVYQISCYVYFIYENIAFVEAEALNFMIDMKGNKLKNQTYYNFLGEIYYDQWNYLGLSSAKIYKKFYKQFEIEGTIKSIIYDTALLKKIKEGQYTSVGVTPKYNYKIEKTTNNGWSEEYKYPHTGGCYLIEFEVDKKYNNNLGHNTQCKSCGNPTTVMTIDNMIEQIEKYIIHNSPIKKLLDFLNIELKDVYLSQNRERLKQLAKNELEIIQNKYKTIYHGKYPIFLEFNENFSQLENISIEVDFFKDYEVMNLLNIDEKTTDTYLQKYLKDMFLLFGEKFSIILDELTIDNRVIKLKLPNERFSQNYACNYFPNTDVPYIYFSYYRDKICTYTNPSNIKNLKIGFEKNNDIIYDNLLGKWLNQEIVYMYPDYGDVCFWFLPNGCAGGIESFERYIDKNSTLYKEFEKWISYFYNCDDETFNWDIFNKVGKNLHKQLQNIVKSDYIIVYESSFEENEARRKSLGYQSELDND
jgi:hypothetical protein